MVTFHKNDADAGLISDHQLIHCKIRARRSVVRSVKVSFRKVKNINIPTFEQALRRSTLFTNPASTADSFADQLADVVSADLDLIAPLKPACGGSRSRRLSGSSRRLLTLNASVIAWKVSGSDTAVSWTTSNIVAPVDLRRSWLTNLAERIIRDSLRSVVYKQR